MFKAIWSYLELFEAVGSYLDLFLLFLLSQHFLLFLQFLSGLLKGFPNKRRRTSKKRTKIENLDVGRAQKSVFGDNVSFGESMFFGESVFLG